jgi:hypothetical protein
MAVTGIRVPSIELYVEDGRLVEGAIMLRADALVMEDVVEAVDKLRFGQTIFLRQDGLNLAWVRKAFRTPA